MTLAPTSMTYEFFARTDKGRVRTNNEDAVAVDRDAQVAILADGMGGYNAGEVASGMATTFIRTEMARWLGQAGPTPQSTDVRRALEICVENANHAILGASLSNPQYAGMGTTLVVGVFHGSRLILGHIGDSRLHIRSSHADFQPLTQDHSLVRRLVDLGQLSEADAAHHPQRNVLFRALGQTEGFKVDLGHLDLVEPTQLLICSDGLWGLTDEEELLKVISAMPGDVNVAQQLCDLANNAGGTDNISVIFVEIS